MPAPGRTRPAVTGGMFNRPAADEVKKRAQEFEDMAADFRRLFDDPGQQLRDDAHKLGYGSKRQEEVAKIKAETERLGATLNESAVVHKTTMNVINDIEEAWRGLEPGPDQTGGQSSHAVALTLIMQIARHAEMRDLLTHIIPALEPVLKDALREVKRKREEAVHAQGAQDIGEMLSQISETPTPARPAPAAPSGGELVSQLAVAENKLVKALREIGQLKAVRTQCDSELSKVKSELDAVAEARKRAEKNALDFEAQLKQVEGELDKARTQLESRDEELINVQEQLDIQVQHTADAEERVAEAKERAEKIGRELTTDRATSAQRLQDADQRVREAEMKAQGQLAEHRATRRVLRNQLDDSRNQAESTRLRMVTAEQQVQLVTEQHSREIEAAEQQAQAAAARHSRELQAVQRDADRQAQAANEQHSRELEAAEQQAQAEAEQHSRELEAAQRQANTARRNAERLARAAAERHSHELEGARRQTGAAQLRTRDAERRHSHELHELEARMQRQAQELVDVQRDHGREHAIAEHHAVELASQATRLEGELADKDQQMASLQIEWQAVRRQRDLLASVASPVNTDVLLGLISHVSSGMDNQSLVAAQAVSQEWSPRPAWDKEGVQPVGETLHACLVVSASLSKLPERHQSGHIPALTAQVEALTRELQTRDSMPAPLVVCLERAAFAACRQSHLSIDVALSVMRLLTTVREKWPLDDGADSVPLVKQQFLEAAAQTLCVRDREFLAAVASADVTSLLESDEMATQCAASQYVLGFPDIRMLLYVDMDSRHWRWVGLWRVDQMDLLHGNGHLVAPPGEEDITFPTPDTPLGEWLLRNVFLL